MSNNFDICITDGIQKLYPWKIDIGRQEGLLKNNLITKYTRDLLCLIIAIVKKRNIKPSSKSITLHACTEYLCLIFKTFDFCKDLQ